MAEGVALSKRKAARGIRSGLGVKMGTLIIVAGLAVVPPLVALTRPSAQVTGRSMLNFVANFIHSLLKRTW